MDGRLDPGIKAWVELLQEDGVKTFESCEGGRGHWFYEPTIRFHGDFSEGFRALAMAQEHHLPVCELRQTWSVLQNGKVEGPVWEMTFLNAAPY